MAFKAGDVAVSLRGHDRGQAYFVLAAREDRVTAANGKRRPKEKNPKHLKAVSVPVHPVAEKLRLGQEVTGRELRSALAALRDQIGGHDAWQKMI